MTVPILIVEDSPEDFEATRRAFRRAGVTNPIYRCQDGEEMLQYLFRRGMYEQAELSPRPGLILLDLNLPGTDGREVLATLKRHEALRSIPVVVVTTSSDERDIDGAYRGGANSYIQKPVDMEAYMNVVKGIADYWLRTVILPGREGER